MKKGLHVIRLLLQEHQRKCRRFLRQQGLPSQEEMDRYWEMWDRDCTPLEDFRQQLEEELEEEIEFIPIDFNQCVENMKRTGFFLL